MRVPRNIQIDARRASRKSRNNIIITMSTIVFVEMTRRNYLVDFSGVGS